MDIDVIVERKSFDMELEVGNPVVEVKAPDHYNGPFDIFPSDEDQIIPVKEKMPVEDICVKGITGEKTITENGTYNTLEDKAVDVNVNPDLRPLSVSENGQYSPDGFDGYSGVEVNVYNHNYSEDYDDFSGGNILALISHKDEYINTGYYPKVCTEYFLKATKDKTYTLYENLFATLFGSIGTRVGIQMYSQSLTNVSFYTTSGAATANIPSSLSADVPTILSTRHLLSADPDIVATKPLLIFCGYYGTGFDRKSQFNFFGLKCYEFGTLVKKYVPWLDENNVPCVHELVDDEYFYNVGTGAFGYIDLEGNVHDA